MILKGNRRGGGRQLAAHLMNSFDNETVELVEVRGAVARDLSGAISEWNAQGRATKMKKKYFYSLSLNPDQEQGHLSREQYFDLIERTERSLNLIGQPRAIVFHEKRDEHGALREHCHVVWSRTQITEDKIKAVDVKNDRLKLRAVAQEFCLDYGLKLPDGMKPRKSRTRNAFNHAQENLPERQQKERTGITKAERMADIAICWNETANGEAFIKALQTKGYFLARGTGPAYVVVDLHGEVHGLSRQLSGVVRSPAIRDRLAAHPSKSLPSIEDGKEWARQQREKLKDQKLQNFDTEKRVAALKEHQQGRRQALDAQRIDMLGRHLSERETMRHMQDAENTGVMSARLKKQPKGLLAFLTRITGIKMITEGRQRRDDTRRAEHHKQQTEALQRRHERELESLDRHYPALDRLEVKENRSADVAFKREEFQKTLALLRKPPGREIQDPFNRAAQQQKRTATADGKPLTPKGDFDKAAKPPLDLTEEFNREVDNRIRRDDRDREPDGPDRGFDPKGRNR
jgi:hypothetical protein